MRALVLFCFLLLSGFARADEPTITVTVGRDTRSFTRGELLGRPDASTIQVTRDVTYRMPMTYRAVPVEPADQPWPPLPKEKRASAGPFYIVWTGAEVGRIRSEQWPYKLAKLARQPSPLLRWPALAVDSALPPTDPARVGQALFFVQCLTCHKLNGAGAADVGPRSQPAAKPD
jgi:hypothetical protein